MIQSKWSWLLTLLVAGACAAFIVACGDDSGSENTGDDTMTGDVTGDTNTNPDTNGVDTNVGTDTNVGVDTMPPPTEVPITWPATPDAYTATYASYINTLVIAEVDPDNGPTCCYDWGDISKDFIEEQTNQMDNALAELGVLLGGLPLGDPIDLQLLISEQLEAGSFAIIWDHQEFSGTDTDDDDFVLAGLFASIDDATWDYAAASAGGYAFQVAPNSFKAGTGEPLIFFNPSEMTSGALTAGPSTFLLSFPLGVVTLDVAVSETLLEGTATVDASGVTYTSGTLAGFVTLEDLVNAINDFAGSTDCACLGLAGDLYTIEADGTVTDNCLDIASAEAACTLPEQETCVVLGAGAGGFATCPLIPSLVAGVSDLDLDGNCATDPDNCDYEGLSVGLSWTAVPATISGIAP